MSTEERVMAWHADEDGTVRGYMWLTDYMSELGSTLGGNTVFPSVRDCKEHRRCEDQEGIVEVEIRFKRVVESPKNLEGLVDELRQYRRSWTVHKIPGAQDHEA